MSLLQRMEASNATGKTTSNHPAKQAAPKKHKEKPCTEQAPEHGQKSTL